MILSRYLDDQAATAALGAELAMLLGPPILIGLRGDLGAGKTTLVRALVQTLLPGTRVKSPTYSLVETYALPAGRELHHLDLYRLRDPAEIEQLALDDLLGPLAMVLIEWPEHGEPWLPPRDIDLVFSHAGEAREVHIEAHSLAGERIVHSLDQPG